MKNCWICLLLCFGISNAQQLRQRTVTLMGSRFDFAIVHESGEKAEAYIDTAIAEIERIENVISEWRPHTEVSKVNRNAGIKPVKVSKELLDLTERALYFSKISDGAFDISFASADKIWKFDGSMTELPSVQKIAESVRRIGYENIRINRKRSTIYLRKKGMKIGFGSIGKGYTADKTKQLLISKGVPSGIVNASGDLNSWGAQPDGSPWNAAISNPLDKNKVFAVLSLDLHTAVVTSGNYEKFAMIGGKRYSHIINPRTGYPASGLASVTILADSAEKANGFSTAIMVLGKEKGLELLAKFPELQGILVSDEGEIHTTANVRLK
ncbi:FAD:protein FMN transferase [Flavobacterium selenitireducens]|uniref:FAD:protein FMN transferase n=1 Tax=Flavobacterium selenitireducens TaxID=2722704 RepID=UPI00168B95AC|nr:FAD:protein FMN transferase [Flavobacterium selenitireducens]MBD3583981.1 FAD:protein FMN transferase [Flavobacterium selenitireducens]